jgi:cytochrome c551/c552
MNQHIFRKASRWVLPFMMACVSAQVSFAQETPKEEDYSRILKMSAPEGTILEVGGLAVLPNGDLGVATRRGDIFIVENATSRRPYFRKFASGLHEILGLEYVDGSFYCAQRGELTKVTDTDMDGKADLFETVYAWPISGHYHEYSFGPKRAPDGSFFVSGNVAFGNEEWWRGESRVPWRGWMINISADGNVMQPWATGMRSPAGISMIDGELFYTDNQGDWFGSGGVWQVKKGDFLGHPAGLAWTDMPNAPLKLKAEQIYAQVDERRLKNEQGRFIKPENIIDEEFKTLADVKKVIPELRLPAVWLPHGILGISNAEIVKIPEGVFAPFSGQLLVGDQGQSKIMRVVLEKVNGEYQGVAFDFRSGFQSGVLRMSWALDGSLFVGETNRGWGSAGDANEGLQRLVWNNRTPFEMKTIKAMPDGFEIEFTMPVDEKSALDVASYQITSHIYKYNSVYGSPPVNMETLNIKGVKRSEDGLKVRLVVDGLRPYYVHTISLDGVRSKDLFYSLVHQTGYYTLNSIPTGQAASLASYSTYNSVKEAQLKEEAEAKAAAAKAAKKPTTTTAKSESAKAPVVAKAPTFEEVKSLLIKHTCIACHTQDKKQIGPAYVDIAKRKYTNEMIVKLIYNPQPQNWPGYATEMPPMPQVPRADALKIAAWINSLK